MNKDRLGYYRVGFKKFSNKTMALLENHRTGYELEWIFNNDVYGSIDWSIPIETPLMELYKRRAQQLREQYDYIVLYYSGGADSTNALHAFMDNNIFIDEIVMHLPEVVKTTLNGEDTSNLNYYSEVEYAAVAHLKKYKNSLHPNTKISINDFSKTGLELLNKEDWFDSSPLCLSVSISGILRQITQEYDGYHLKLQEKDKSIAYVLGIDKPLVYFNGVDYFCYFMDTSTYHYISPVDFNKSGVNNVSTEFFYWTPDMPEIVIKQAQDIKRHCEKNPWAKFMASEALTRHISEYRPVLHPVIYPDYTCEQFQTEKPSTHIMRPMDNWFWQTATDNVKGNYLNTIKYLENNTNSKYMIKNDINYGIAAHKTKFYKI
jgi:hypothetical protein